MIDLTEILHTAPNVFVSGLPESAAVDLVMSRSDAYLESLAPHNASPAVLADTQMPIERFLVSCTNPATLAAAAEWDRVPAEVLANPATERSERVRSLTATMAGSGELAKAFSSIFAGPRRVEYDRETHADLLEALEADPGILGYELDAVFGFGAEEDFAPYADTGDLFSNNELNARIRDMATRGLHRTMGRIDSEGTQLGKHLALVLDDPELSNLLATDPLQADAQTLAELRDAVAASGPDSPDLGPSTAHAAVAALSHWVLGLDAAGRFPDVAAVEAAMPRADISPVWAREWIDRGLLADDVGPTYVELPWVVAAEAGRYLWETLGDNQDAWVVALELCSERWDGTIQDLASTAAAAAA